MKTVAIILALIFAVPFSNAKDRIYPRLNKLYVSQPNKCLKRSKQIIKLLPKVPSAYYFAGKISNDKASHAKMAQHKYRYMLAAISYAQKFQKLADSSTKAAYGWDEVISSMQTNLIATEALLEETRNFKLSKNLNSKWPAFLRGSQTTIPSEITLSDLEEESPNSPAPELEVSETKTVSNSNQLFGMPSGTENLSSANLNDEKKLLRLINQERLKKGMDSLTWNDDLARACRYHATDLATQNYFDHDSYDLINGKLVKKGGTFDRIKRFYKLSFVNSENLAAGSSQPSGTYEQWYNSPGHNRNMFNSSSKKVGIGVVYLPGSEYGYYWVFCTAE